MEPITVTFKHERETKNTQRFTEDVAEGVKPTIGTIYVSKEVAGDSKSLTAVLAFSA